MSVFDELERHAGAGGGSARMLPLSAYTDEVVAATELVELYGRDWLCVGRVSDVPSAGDYVTAEIPHTSGGARSLVVLRGTDGAVRVFDNVCVHRGAELLSGCGSATRITCPYHAWVYRSDGSLVGAPYMSGSLEADGAPFDPTRHRLREVRTEIWQGLVFVTQNADAASLAPSLVGLTEVVDRYGMADYVSVHDAVDVWRTNWKLLVENFMDAYHVFKVHQRSFGATGDTTDDTVVLPGTDHWAHHRVVESSGPDLAHESNERLTGDWRTTTVLAAVFPGFVVQLQPDWMWHLRITPLGTDHVRIAWQVAVAPDMLAAQPDRDAYVAEVMRLIHLVNDEDQPIVEGIRRAVERPQFDRAPLAALEGNVVDFDRYIARRLTR